MAEVLSERDKTQISKSASVVTDESLAPVERMLTAAKLMARLEVALRKLTSEAQERGVTWADADQLIDAMREQVRLADSTGASAFGIDLGADSGPEVKVLSPSDVREWRDRVARTASEETDPASCRLVVEEE